MEVKEKEDLKEGQLVAILEAMKLEINVNVPESKKGKMKVEKLLVEPVSPAAHFLASFQN